MTEERKTGVFTEFWFGQGGQFDPKMIAAMLRTSAEDIVLKKLSRVMGKDTPRLATGEDAHQFGQDHSAAGAI